MRFISILFLFPSTVWRNSVCNENERSDVTMSTYGKIKRDTLTCKSRAYVFANA